MRITRIEAADGRRGRSVRPLKGRVREGDSWRWPSFPRTLLGSARGRRRSDARLRALRRESLDSDHVELIERALGQAVVRVRAARAGPRPETPALALMRRPRPT